MGQTSRNEPVRQEHPNFTPEELEAFRQQRIKRIQTEGAIRRVECPRCGALVGEDCHSKPKYYIGGFHVDRKKLAGVQ